MLSNIRGLTFDDVILVPGYNGIKSRQNVTTSVEVLGKTFGIPLISSNMDTITEDSMANAMTEMGAWPFFIDFFRLKTMSKCFKK